MATTITCGVMRSGSRGVRASINNHLFIECGVFRSGSRAPDAKVRAGVGAGAMIVDSWTPADGADDVDHNHSLKVNFHANAGAIEKEFLYDGGGTFAAGGALTDVTEVGDGIQLAVDAEVVDFDDYAGGYIKDGVGPHTWTWLGDSTWYWYTIDDGDSWDGRHIKIATGNGTSHHRLDDAGTMDQGIVACDVFFDSEDTGNGLFGLTCNLTGSGSALRGHAIVAGPGAQYMTLKRMTAAHGWTGIGSSINIGYPSKDVVYGMKLKFSNSGGTTAFYFKWWDKTGAEPAGWTWIGTDTVYVGAGYTGIVMNSGASGAVTRADNFSSEVFPSAYVSGGDWTSDEIDTTSIGLYSHALVEWDETAPTDTTVAVKSRWKNGGTWEVCTNGDQIPGIDLGEDMTAGSSKDSLELKVELATTDSGATPVVENLRFYHEPVANSAIEIDLGGQSCAESDGTLEIWGKRQISGGSNVIAWDDVWCDTFLASHLFGLDYSLLVKLVYNGVDIDEIIVSMARDYWAESSPMVGWMFSMDPIKYASAPIEVRYNVREGWAPMGHVFEWVLIDQGIGIHADVWYIVGHYQLDNHPGSFLVGTRELVNHPGSLLVKGIQRDNHPGSFLVQGWRLDNHPGSALVGVQEHWNHPGSFIVAIEQLDNHPGSFLVYGVNRDGAIMVKVIDTDTYDKLVAEGIVFS